MPNWMSPFNRPRRASMRNGTGPESGQAGLRGSGDDYTEERRGGPRLPEKMKSARNRWVSGAGSGEMENAGAGDGRNEEAGVETRCALWAQTVQTCLPSIGTCSSWLPQVWGARTASGPPNCAGSSWWATSRRNPATGYATIKRRVIARRNVSLTPLSRGDPLRSSRQTVPI